MSREGLAIDGLLRELARAGDGEDDALVERVVPRPGWKRYGWLLLVAAGCLLVPGLRFAADRCPARLPVEPGASAHAERILLQPGDFLERIPARAPFTCEALDGAGNVLRRYGSREALASGDRRAGCRECHARQGVN
jgi:hypothetical protein